MNGVTPVHEPVLALRVCPSRAVPEITGRALFAGAFATTTAVEADVAFAEPLAFFAVTITLKVVPTLPDPSAYVALVAPLRFAQLSP